MKKEAKTILRDIAALGLLCGILVAIFFGLRFIFTFFERNWAECTIGLIVGLFIAALVIRRIDSIVGDETD